MTGALRAQASGHPVTRTLQFHAMHMARNFGHARAVNIQTWENLKQYGYTKL